MRTAPEPSPRRPRGRPAKLSRQRIVAVATALTAESGLGEFSVQMLAERLGCTPMSLYHHVENRATLERLIVEHISASDPLPPLPPPGGERAWLLATVQQVRTRLLAHPGVAEHLLVHGPTGPSLNTVDRVATVLLAAGVPIDRLARAYGLLMTTTTGLALQQTALERRRRQGSTAFERFHADMNTSTSLVRRIAADFTTDRDAVFDYAVNRVLDGILVDAT